MGVARRVSEQVAEYLGGRVMRTLSRPSALENALRASSNSSGTATVSGLTDRVPVSMQATSMRSPIRCRMLSACSLMIRWYCDTSASYSGAAESSKVVAEPLMAARGARNSCPIIPKNSVRSRSNSSNCFMSCNVATNDSTSPASVRREVTLTSTLTQRPSEPSMVISSASTVSPERTASARAEPRPRTARPPAR